MSTALRTRHAVPGSKAPPSEISISLIDSLYKDGRTFLVGTVLVTGPAFILYWKTGEILLLTCALAFALVAGARGILSMRISTRAQPSSIWKLPDDGSVATLREQRCPTPSLGYGVTSPSRRPRTRSSTSSAFRWRLSTPPEFSDETLQTPALSLCRFFACGRRWRPRSCFTEIPTIGFSPAFSPYPFSG